MKRFLLYLFILFAPLYATAQLSPSLEIDPSSLAPIQTDAISGVTIDKIKRDPSQRPCARIKMHINRMTKEDIAGISVRPVGGSVVVTKQIVATEGNGLIIELTAKAGTRLYLHHDRYGDSNEVSLDLEGDKEYKLNAQLKLLQTVVISSNITEADVYIDNIFKGRTGPNFDISIKDVTPGAHKLRIEYGGAKSEQDIVVDSSNIHFRLNLKQEQARPQFVVIGVEPTNASVTIDGKSYVPDGQGYVTTLLNNGSYNYSVSSKSYYTETGSFIVNGAKVIKNIKLRPAHGWLSVSGSGALQGASVYVDGELIGTAPIKSDKLASGKHSVRIVKSLYKTFEGEVTISDGKSCDYAPSLVADFATITLTVGNDCDIYINDELKGKGSWRGDLATGAYIFEARKEGHTTTSISRTIEATPAEQKYNIPAPTPILGALNITSSPIMADVYIDNKLVGQTPLSIDLIVGKHTIKVVKENLGIEPQNITISESKTENLNFTLAEIVPQGIIKYTTKNGKKVNPKETAFGANIISNTYENGIGIIKFKKPIRKIGKNAFRNCTSLTSVTIPDSVTEIGDSAFNECTSLTSVTIPNSVTSIGSHAFYNCTSLTSVTIPNSVTEIGDGAFVNCDGLTSITIPNSVTKIGRYAFCGCNGLQHVNSSLQSCMILPNGIKTIGEFAFADCTSLKSATIGNSVTSIGERAFRDCTSLTSITIPNSVTSIGECAFSGCTSLKSVFCKATTPPTAGYEVFSYYNKEYKGYKPIGCKIYVPRNSAQAYKSAEGWKKYRAYIVSYDF